MTKSFRETNDYEGIDFFDPLEDELKPISNCDHLYAFLCSSLGRTETYKCCKCGDIRKHTRNYD